MDVRRDRKNLFQPFESELDFSIVGYFDKAVGGQRKHVSGFISRTPAHIASTLEQTQRKLDNGTSDDIPLTLPVLQQREMSRRNILRLVRSVKPQTGQRGIHGGLFDGREYAVQTAQKFRQTLAKLKAVTHGGLHHTHQHCRGQAVAGSVRDACKDVAADCNQIDEISAGILARNGSPVRFNEKIFVYDSGSQRVLNCAGEPPFPEDFA